MALTLHIVTPAATVVQSSADSVVAPAAEGQIGVLPGHENLLAALDPGVIVYRDSAGEQRVAVAGGFAEVASDRVTILADDAAQATSIDRGSAEARRARAESALDETTLATPAEEVARLRRELSIAEAWLTALG